MAQQRQIKLGFFVRPAGHHVAGWRHPEAVADAAVNFPHFVEMAKTAERGLFDMLFAADNVTVWDGSIEGLSRMSYVVWFEPFSLMSALASVTSHIGLVCTSTTTYDEPYHIARRFLSLDQISGGRAGWNLVTSAVAAEAANFGRDIHLPHGERYKRAREFAEVVRGLWDSWDDDAFLRDKDSGLFFRPDAMHVLDHQGEHFRVRGPLNVARSPQGQPVMVQAGSSDDGKELAAETAEVVFTAQPTLEGARAFYADLKGRMAKYGRAPDEIKIMPGIFAIIGRTAEEAEEKYQRLQSLIHPKVGLVLLSTFIGFDLSNCSPDDPLPEIPEASLAVSRSAMLTKMAREENLTLRQLYTRIAGARGHREIRGSAVQIADQLEEWFTTGAADGFNFLAPYLPGCLDDFVELVIPELQRRGLYRRQYEGRTLRENLGLKRPKSRYQAAGL